ncbi:amino acid adenylation domain-containing protein [Chitinophaga qingshengii]|uniref:Amino acid adenylation domain-containing protein n=1 Tax=Chitinophaga qingshengii TaxID=1569794 RepID=A0ABR7TIG4_9BACT|nr:amino acid adenylation domain-containing protein [Chitinophaga qingshengii]MBC9929262.1 amino acid adenylation domain-containing protein [Chitinophaga qingshengii]
MNKPVYPDIAVAFEAMAQKKPHYTALICGDQVLTWKALSDMSGALAVILQNKGIGPDKIVGLLLDRSPEMMIAILAVLKAGGAFLPFSVTDPQQRLNHLLEDSATTLILTTTRYAEKYQLPVEHILLDSMAIPAGVIQPEPGARPEDLAYVIYTSGSTGMPKGVMIERYALMNRLMWMQESYAIGEYDVVLQKTPYTFDVSVWELLWWSFTGATICFLAPGMEKFPLAISSEIIRCKVTVIHFVPSMLGNFLYYLEEARPPLPATLKKVFSSGEALKSQHVTDFYRVFPEGPLLVNLYGPTEAAIDVTFYDVPAQSEHQIPIGQAITGVSVWVVKDGVAVMEDTGEIMITGHGLARGYLNRVELTAEKFFQCPATGGQRAYRTGDNGRLRKDGQLEYNGRIDFQVKIHGIRIELGEIEAAVNRHPLVKDCIVLVKRVAENVEVLSAFCQTTGSLEAAGLRQFLALSLPEYMVPRQYFFLPFFPLTSNGKADRAALLQYVFFNQALK